MESDPIEGTNMVRIPPVALMGDETLIKHLELRHDNDLRMQFMPEPQKETPRVTAPKEWRTFHETMHRLHPNDYNHVHNEE
jgi:hypothetical protein